METNTNGNIDFFCDNSEKVDLTKTHILLLPTAKIISTLKTIKMKDIPHLHISLQHFAIAYLMANTASFITIEDFVPLFLSNLSINTGDSSNG